MKLDKRQSSLIYGLMVLTVIEFGIWGMLRYGWKGSREISFSSVVEEALNRALLNLGIKEKNLVRKYWRETSDEAGERWVEIYEEFVVNPSTSLNEVLKSIDGKVRRLGGRIFSYNFLDKGRQLEVHLGVGEKVTHSLLITKRRSPRISIIIDDMGYGGRVEEEILKIPYPLNISVLPRLQNSRRTAELAHRYGFEVMLHLPLESLDTSLNRTPGLITTGMGKDEVLQALKEDLKSVPYAKGMNNHEGSRAMAEERIITEIMRFAKEENLFFVDSLTTPSSCAQKIAIKEKVSYKARDIFLDNKREEKYIEEQLWELLSQSASHGEAIGIGHPYPETLEVLKKTLPKIEAEGFQIVPLSQLFEK